MQVDAVIKVQKVGDSLMVIIPSKVSSRLGIAKGDSMQVLTDNQDIIYQKQAVQK